MFTERQREGVVDLATAQQRKPAAGKAPSAGAKTANTKPKPAKKPSAKQIAEAQHRARLLRAWILGLLTLLGLALALIPGQNIWTAAHNAIWGFFGLPLVGWAAFAFYCCNVWLHNKNLGHEKTPLLCQALLLLFLGAVFYLFTRSKENIAGGEFAAAVNSVFYQGKTPIAFPDILRGGWAGAVLGAGLARACGGVGAMLISVLVTVGSAPLAFPRLRERLVDIAAGRYGPDAPDKPERAEAVSVEKTAKLRAPKAHGRKTRTLEDDLAELERLGGEIGGAAAESSARHGIFERFGFEPEATGTSASAIPTVADLPPGDTAAGELANSLTGDNAKRRRAKQAGDDAVRAAMEANLSAASRATDHPDYQPPPLSCLSAPRTHGAPDKGEEDMIARKLVYTLDSFGVAVELVGRSRGPAVTRYELRPAEGVKISKITSLADDIALRLAATKVRIEAPIPGKPAVGVEVPNRVRAVVTLRELVDSDNYRAGAGKSKLTVALGKDIVGDLVCADLAKLPHLLIAGTTGSGKSVCMNTLILSMLYNASPEDVKLLMVDPKQVEFNVYSGIPHLLVPVVSDPLKAAGALGWAVNEMERRYTRISEQNVRDLDSYNNIAAMQDDLEHMPKIVIFIDELSDLMMVAPSDVEDSIQRLTQKGRAAGIHLVVATQRPSVDVITGVIKSNLPGRIALSVASQIDSRTIINSSGAEQLLGNGDMLFSLNGGNNAVRVQGCFVSDPEVQKVVNFIKDTDGSGNYDDSVWEEIGSLAAAAGRGKKKGGMLDSAAEGEEESDPMLDSAIEVVVNAQMASTTMLQKKLKLGYARASRVVDLLEARGIVGPPEGAKPRKVLMSHAQYQEYMAVAPEKRGSFGESGE
jgi:S-DNA-T family DNA segregation ATPase FtsK/SpoIIIE